SLWPRYETSGWKSSHFLAFRRKPAARILLNNASNFWSICIVACIYLPTPASLLEVVHLPLSLGDLEQC
ncbi:Acyl-lipid omega-3 desaturase (cytochrome b5), endoplasmic reticulum, partial [Frankliniella fusca]